MCAQLFTAKVFVLMKTVVQMCAIISNFFVSDMMIRYLGRKKRKFDGEPVGQWEKKVRNFYIT